MRDLASRRELLVAAAGACLALPVWAQTVPGFPARPLRLVVPFPPGGPTDLVARPLAVLLSAQLGQQVVVENRGGAGGSVAGDAVAKSPPDGHTLLMGTVGTQSINQSLYKSLPYDPVRDLVPLGIVGASAVVAVAHPSAPYKTLTELVAAAKRGPGQINYATAGNGTPGHLTGHMFARAAGVSLSHVPYKGSAAGMTDLVGGQIQLMFDPVQSVLANVKAGRVLALGVSGRARSAVLPAVPTFAESGVAGLTNFETTPWWGVFGPSAIPAPVRHALIAAVRQVAQSADFQSRMEQVGVAVPTMNDEATAAFLRAEVEKWGAAVRESGATAE